MKFLHLTTRYTTGTVRQQGYREELNSFNVNNKFLNKAVIAPTLDKPRMLDDLELSGHFGLFLDDENVS